jgi:hypothetical protein
MNASLVRGKYATTGYIPSDSAPLSGSAHRQFGTVLANRSQSLPVFPHRFFKRSTAQDVLSKNSNRDTRGAQCLRRHPNRHRITDPKENKHETPGAAAETQAACGSRRSLQHAE